MIVLGFDTATHATVVGLRLADGVTLQARDDPPPEAHPGHATRLLEMAGRLLAEAGVRWSALQRIAVGVGPGRFTGLRVGVATARGLRRSLGVELVGVSSLRALALAAGEQAPGRAILAVIDARRDEAFAAAYPQPIDFSGVRTGDDGLPGEAALARAISRAHMPAILEQIQPGHPASPARWLAVGDGAVRFCEELRAGGIEVAAADSPLHAIDARAVCTLGALVEPADSTEPILPDYRRAPDAALARERPLALGGTAS